ncbi:MAG: hypothetical protein HUK13_09140 [Muribaculaceae bacterium]|nr:hypothetical protein [Muribaculaceae bacterium]
MLRATSFLAAILLTVSLSAAVLWQGEEELDTWLGEGITLSAATMANAEEGATLKVDFTLFEGADFGQIELCFPDGNYASATVATTTDADEFGVYRPGVEGTSFTVDAADAEQFRAQGLWLKGQKVIVTAISLEPKKDDDPSDDPGNPGDDPENPGDPGNPGNPGDDPADPGEDALTTVSRDADTPVRYYLLDGQSIAQPQKGMVVIRISGADSNKIVF